MFPTLTTGRGNRCDLRSPDSKSQFRPAAPAA
jgi:hypothetical protein